MVMFTATVTAIAVLGAASANAQALVISRSGSRAAGRPRRRTSPEGFRSRCCSRPSIRHTRAAGW